ncbi:hypothetical protein BDP81DRAFT_63395 [Colletotrichum phormii]|uniref:Uncharacterized protein n=1 Tax=Colletotrichum phormii TaxID=359342 RepID=A0AAI9ZNK9_9PEZI|nr:uncharacterized protein BDP81DRAFT_63395 [Colletotrichum phormii]KAK1633932.1 hypothetical protein BDP81DRAFT_63395 [Colletotrichum phormii]
MAPEFRRAQKPQKSLVCVLGGFPERLLGSLSATRFSGQGTTPTDFRRQRQKKPKSRRDLLEARPPWSPPVRSTLSLCAHRSDWPTRPTVTLPDQIAAVLDFGRAGSTRPQTNSYLGLLMVASIHAAQARRIRTHRLYESRGKREKGVVSLASVRAYPNAALHVCLFAAAPYLLPTVCTV